MRIEEYCNVANGGLVLREPLQRYIRFNIISADPSINRQLNMLERVAASDIPLLIRGELGCGKDHIAQYAHDISIRKSKPFLKINCSYYPEVQTVNKLFGASGLLRQAEGGSLYIENINTLSPQTQQQLWEFISSKEGQQQNIRFMTCLRDDAKVAFIEPLTDYFGSMEFHLPPLRERPVDTLLLTMQRLQFIQEQYHVTRLISPNVMEAILDYEWPENIRQLVRTIDRMAFMSDHTLMNSVNLFQNCLSSHKQTGKPHAAQEPQPENKTLKELVADYEVTIINQYVERYGSLRKAAAALGISHSALSSKLTKFYAAPPAK